MAEEGKRTWESVSVQAPDQAGVARILLSRPSQANALNASMFRELPLALQELDDNRSVHVIILSAEGKNFCAGIDLSTLSNTVNPASNSGGPEAANEREMLRRGIKVMQRAFTAIETCRKPVLAAIHGACIGGGIDLITACDLRYCTEDAKFSVREVDLAITADLGTLQRLPFVIGYSKAMELALTARMFDGKEANRLGLVNGVFPFKEDLEKEVSKIATQMAEKSPLAIMGTKAVLLKSRDISVAEGLDYVATWNTALVCAGDIKESVTAKLEKRKPIFAKL